MKKEDFVKGIFIALNVVVFIKIFDFFFNIMGATWRAPFLADFFYISILVLFLASIVWVYPKLLDLGEELKKDLGKFVVWGWTIWLFLLFISLFVSGCRIGTFPGLNFCAQNFTLIGS